MTGEAPAAGAPDLPPGAGGDCEQGLATERGATDGAPHLRIEFISEAHTRRVLFFQGVLGLAAWGLLIWEVVVQYCPESSSLMHGVQLEAVNLTVASLCLALLGGVGAWFGASLARGARRGWGKGWGPRRKYLVAMTSLEVLLELVNLASYLAVNIYSYQTECGWFDTAVDLLNLVAFTAWNILFFLHISRALILLPAGSWQRLARRLRRWRTAQQGRCCCRAAGGSDTKAGLRTKRQSSVSGRLRGRSAIGSSPITLDGPVPREDARMALRVHLAAFCALWVPLQAFIVAAVLKSMDVYGANILYVCPSGSTDGACAQPLSPDEMRALQPDSDCRHWTWVCSLSGAYLASLVAAVGLMLLPPLTFLAIMLLVRAEYRRLPYTPYRVVNVMARLTLRTRVAASLFFLTCLIFAFYLNLNSCTATMLLWLGLGPMHISMTALLAAEAFLYSPSPPQRCALKLHASLQRFAWTEADAPGVVARRGHPDEPLFCLETALKASYLCLHSYRHFRPGSTLTSLRTAMELYRCRHYEWLREPALDVNCLLCWGPDALVVAFRGTQSMANVRADAQFWRSSHPPQRGVLLLGTRPLVHAGFMAAWAGHGLDAQVLQRVREVLEGRRHAAMSSCVCTVARCCGGRHDGAEEAELASAASAAAAVEMTGYGEGGGVEGEEEENEGEEEEAEGWLSAEDEAAAARAVAAAAAAAGAAAAARGSEGEAASPSHYMPAGDSDSTPPEAPSGGHGVAPPPAPKAAPAAGWPGVEQPPPDGGCSPGGDSPGGSSNGGSDGGSPSSRRRQQQQPFRLLVTGHSLGGAVATLCALDLARHLPLWGFTTVVAPSSPAGCSAAVVAAPSGAPAASAAAAGSGSCSAQPEPGGSSSAADTAAYGGGKAAEPRPQRRPVAVSCYSFGGPRTGNHALAREYWRAVPDSWAVINGQDLVARSPKFLVFFKRCGRVAIVDGRGDLIVNPSFLESHVQRSYHASLAQHQLVSYNRSFAAILRGQRGGKGLSGGAEAVTLLAANPAVRELLLKPLAMQPASLRCHLSVGAAGGGQGAREAPPWAAAAGEAPQVIVVGSAAAGRDAEAGRSGADGPPGEAEP